MSLDDLLSAHDTYTDRFADAEDDQRSQAAMSKLLDEAAEVIADLTPDDRAGRVIYILEVIDFSTPDDEMRRLYKSMRNSIINRLTQGRW